MTEVLRTLLIYKVLERILTFKNIDKKTVT